MSNIIPLPVATHRNAGSLIQKIARDSSRVVVTNHCEERMLERGVTMAQLLRCLTRGREVDLELDNNTGCYKVTFEARSAGVRVKIVAALDKDESGGFAIAITAITGPL